MAAVEPVSADQICPFRDAFSTALCAAALGLYLTAVLLKRWRWTSAKDNSFADVQRSHRNFVVSALIDSPRRPQGWRLGSFPRYKAKKNSHPRELLEVFLAEAVRFELTNGSHRRQFSRLLPSTTRPRFLLHGIIHNRRHDEGVLTRLRKLCSPA